MDWQWVLISIPYIANTSLWIKLKVSRLEGAEKNGHLVAADDNLGIDNLRIALSIT